MPCRVTCAVLLAHLLKWRYQPQRRRRSWQTSILNARTEILQRLERQPSLQQAWLAMLAWAYPKARRLAATETGLPLTTFPEECPWGTGQVLDEEFLPEADHEA
jgi:hypothetical protein